MPLFSFFLFPRYFSHRFSLAFKGAIKGAIKGLECVSGYIWLRILYVDAGGVIYETH